LLKEVMSECNRIIQQKLSFALLTAKPEMKVLALVDDQVQKYVSPDSEVGKLFLSMTENARVSYSAALNECVQQQKRQWVKLLKSLQSEFKGMAELCESTQPDKAAKAIRQITADTNILLCRAITSGEKSDSTPSKPIKSCQFAEKSIGKFEAVVPASPAKQYGPGRPGSSSSASRNKDNSYAKVFARQLDDSRNSYSTSGLFR
jgi:hypothetical protein